MLPPAASRYAGFLAIPAALFGAALAPGLLSAAYAAVLVGGCLASSLRLQPPVQTAVVPFSQVLGTYRVHSIASGLSFRMLSNYAVAFWSMLVLLEVP